MSWGESNRVIHDLEDFLEEELDRLKDDDGNARCEVILVKAKLASLFVRYGYEK